jgi:1-acyl-sn-glycerol-3-phosphate acyltransferase
VIGARLLADGSGVLLRMLGVRLHLYGRAHVPSDGPCIVASNHVSYVDFAVIQRVRPDGWPPLRFLARWDLVPPGPAWPLMRRLGLIPVDERRAPGRSLPEALDALAAGRPVGVHPEGSVRVGEVPARGRGGAVRLARAAGVPLIPCSVWGTQQVLTRGRRVPPVGRRIGVDVRFGPPVEPDGPNRHATERLMAAIAALTAESRARPPHRDRCPRRSS